MEQISFDLSTKIKTHICYAQIFDSVLTLDQINTLCGKYDTAEVSKTISILENSGAIKVSGKYVHLINNTTDFEKIKNERINFSNEVISDNSSLLKILSKLPFILMIGISGSIAHDNAKIVDGELPDLDLFIITKPDSLYATRFILMLIRKLSHILYSIGILKKRISIDPNYLMEVDNLEVGNQSFFTAFEAVTLKLIKGKSIYQHFLDSNRWISNFFSLDKKQNYKSELGTVNKTGKVLQGCNLFCFSFLFLYNRVNSVLFGKPISYSNQPKPDITGSFRAIQHVGGGYQPQIASRFGKLYETSFGKNEELENFLFPNTTEHGVKHRSKTIYTQSGSLGYGQ